MPVTVGPVRVSGVPYQAAKLNGDPEISFRGQCLEAGSTTCRSQGTANKRTSCFEGGGANVVAMATLYFKTYHCMCREPGLCGLYY